MRSVRGLGAPSQWFSALAGGLLLTGGLAGCATTPGGSGATAGSARLVLPPAPVALARWRLQLSDVDGPSRRRQVDLAQGWILGNWETFEHRSGSVEGVARFEFRREGPELKWRMMRSGWVSGVQTIQTASGSVSRLSESAVELRGRYESSNLGNVVGTSVQQSLTRQGDCLRGFEAASDGRESLLSLRRAR